MPSLDDIEPKSGKDRKNLEDFVDLLDMSSGKWIEVRFLPGNILPMKRHWISIITPKQKKKTSIPKMCTCFDPATGKNVEDGQCPYCDLPEEVSKPEDVFFANAIVRSQQDAMPAKLPKMTSSERESGHKEIDSRSWTPVRVVRMPSSFAKKIKGIRDLNTRTIKGEEKKFSANHERYGVNVKIKYDASGTGTDKYQVNMAEASPLTEEELKFLTWDLSPSLLAELGIETFKEAKKSLAGMELAYEGGSKKGRSDDDDDDEDDEPAPKRGKAPAKRGKPADDEDDDLDDDDLNLDDDEDDEPAPKRGTKKPAAKASSKRKPADDEDDLDDDEDDEPAPKRGGKRKPVDDDEDDDEDDLDDDDDDDEPAPKRGAKKPAAKSKRKPVDDDEDDLDDDDEPAPKRGKSASKRKPVDDDEDDLDDDDDDDEPAPKRGGKRKPVDDDEDDDLDDDEDEPAPKRGAKKPAAKTSSKRKPVDDDEDDDLDDDEDDEPAPKRGKKKIPF